MISLISYQELFLDASIAVHKVMGPGLLESVYQQCLAKELSLRSVNFSELVPIPLNYKGYVLNKEYVIEEEIVLELKAV